MPRVIQVGILAPVRVEVTWKSSPGNVWDPEIFGWSKRRPKRAVTCLQLVHGSQDRNQT